MIEWGRDGYYCIVGLFDFGDVVYIVIINELVVVLVYFMMEQFDFVGVVVEVICGYYKVFLLEEVEVAVLFVLVWVRLFISVIVFIFN